MGRLEAVSLYKGKQQAYVAHTGPSAASGAELGDGVTAGTDSTWAWELQSTPAPEGQTQTHGCYKQSSAHNDGKEKQS